MSKTTPRGWFWAQWGGGKGEGQARRNTEWQASSGKVQGLARRSHPKGSADYKKDI